MTITCRIREENSYLLALERAKKGITLSCRKYEKKGLTIHGRNEKKLDGCYHSMIYVLGI